MRPRTIGEFLIALALVLGASGSPARAALPGFHAAYFSESAFVTLKAGQTGQFSVGYTNTGDKPWLRAVPFQGASLHTSAPFDNTTDFFAGWSNNWVAPNVYARQANDLTSPGQIGFFTYNITVPATAPTGPHYFYGRPVIEGVGPLEDYGYYQVVTVTPSSYTLTIASTTPASPSTTNQPQLNGIGAPPNATITILDGGSNTVGTGTADATGAFQITTSILSIASHSLTASAPGAGTSPAVIYTVLQGSTGGGGVPPSGGCNNSAISLSRPGTYTAILTFNAAIQSGPVTAANYKANSADFPSAPTLRSDSLAVRLDFPSTALPATGTNSFDIYNQFVLSTGIAMASPISCTFTIQSDTTQPTLGGVAAVGSNVIDVNFSESMRSSAYFPAGTIDSTSRYNLSNPDGSAATTGGASGLGSPIAVSGVATGGNSTDAGLFGITKARVTLSGSMNPGTNYTLQVSGVQDEAGNSLAPVVGVATVAFGAASVLPTLNQVTGTQVSLTFLYSKAMAHAAPNDNVARTCTGGGTQIDAKANYTLQSPINTAMSSSGTTCQISSDERTIVFTFPASTGYSTGGPYTVSVAGVSDSVSSSNLITPNPTNTNVSINNSAPLLAGAHQSGPATMTVTFSEGMYAPDVSSDNSAINPNNYSINSGPYGTLCTSGGPTITTSDAKTFTINCTTGAWTGSSSDTVQVRRVVDTDGSLTISPNPSATSITP